LVVGYGEPTDGVKEVKKPYKFVYEAVDPSKYVGNGQDVKVTIYHDGKYAGQSTFYSAKGASAYRAGEAFKKTKLYDQYKDGKTVKEVVAGGGDPKPIYGKDPNGNIIVDKSKAGQTETIPASFSGDGMINLLGDSRNVQEFTTRQATQEDVAAGLASEVGESITEATGDRKAGFDADGNFLGLSALAEDIQRGNLSRQREADLADVERLSDRYQGVMEDYRPAATSGLDGARELLEEQKEAMTTGGGAITKPTGSTYGGDVTAATMTAAQVGQGPTLDASTSYTPSASVSGGTFDAGTSYTASQVADPLRLQAATLRPIRKRGRAILHRRPSG